MSLTFALVMVLMPHLFGTSQNLKRNPLLRPRKIHFGAALALLSYFLAFGGVAGCHRKPLDSSPRVDTDNGTALSDKDSNPASIDGETEGRHSRSMVGESNEKKSVNEKTFVVDALARLKNNELTGLETILADQLVNDPSNADALYWTACLFQERQCRESQVNIESCLYRFEQSIALGFADKSSAAKKWKDVAERFSKRGCPAGALAAIQRAVRQQPADAFLRQQAAAYANSYGDRSDANAHLRLVALVRPSDFGALRCLIVPEVTFFDFQERPDPNDRSLIQTRGRLNVARALLDKGQVTDAKKVLDSTPSWERSQAAFHSFWGRWIVTSNQPERLEPWFASWPAATVGTPGKWTAEQWLGIGYWLLQRDEIDNAKASFELAARKEPGDLTARFRLMEMARRAGEVEKEKELKNEIAGLRRTRRLLRLIYEGDGNEASALEIADIVRDLGRPIEAVDWELQVLNRRLGAQVQRSGTSANQTMLAAIKRRQEIVQDHQSALRPPAFSVSLTKPVQSEIRDSRTRDASPGGQSKIASSPSSQSENDVELVVEIKEAASSLGVEFQYVPKASPNLGDLKIHQAMGGGVAVLDFDGDGNEDLYFGQGGPSDRAEDLRRSTQSDQLFRSMDARFERVTSDATIDERRYTIGVSSGDWNQDGWPDLMISNVGQDRVLLNQGDGTFQTLDLPVASKTDQTKMVVTTQSVIADLNGDSLPDLFQCRYLDDKTMLNPLKSITSVDKRAPAPGDYRGGVDRVLERFPDGSFRSIPMQVDGVPVAGKGMNPVVGPFAPIDSKTGRNAPAHPMIFVANDLMPNRLWKHDANSGTWVDQATTLGLAVGARGRPDACMGVAVGDFDRDLQFDFHVTNFTNQWSNLFVRRGNLFVDRVTAFQLADATSPMTGFGTVALDVQADGWDDLFIGNGHIFDSRWEGIEFQMPNQLFVGGRNGFQMARPVKAGQDPLLTPGLTRGVARIDLDRDGDEDLVTVGLGEPVRCYLLEAKTRMNSVGLRLVGTVSERDAVGSVVELLDDQGTVFKRVPILAGEGYASSSSRRVVIGCGEKFPDSIRVRWPGTGWEQFDWKKPQNLNSFTETLVKEGGSIYRYVTPPR